MAQWWWCFAHQRAEPEGDECRADDRLGPYDSRAEAEDWRAKVEARNDLWDDGDDG